MNKLTLLLIVVSTCFTAYCQDEKNIEINVENLSKKWEMVDIINPEKTAEELEEMKSMLDGTYLEFNSDSTFTFSFVVDLDGTWELKENDILTKDRKGENKWVIHSLQEKRLIASRNESTQKIVYKSK